MAGGGGRSLEETPTWAVAVVCFVLVVVSIIIEYILHLIGKWLKKKHKRSLYEALEKIESELMVLGFISLLLTVGQVPISNICIPESVAATWHPCNNKQEQALDQTTTTSHVQVESDDVGTNGRRLLASFLDSDSGSSRRRFLAGGGGDKCGQGKVPFVSTEGIHQLHIFIFVLAVFHILYCILTLILGRAKMGRWRRWEDETKTAEYQFAHDPERFRFARDTSFGRRHNGFWTKMPFSLWIICFFRQFIISVPKVDYLTLRHGFIMAHLGPNSFQKFDFQKYIKRSLEEDFKVVVGISPPIWFISVLFLLFNTHGWYSYLWLPFIPLAVILMVGTKLQVIITKMGIRIQERGEVVKGVPVVQPGDDLFWFKRPRLLLYLINYVLFQNAFQLAFFTWTSLQFGWRSCFHSHTEDIVIRVTMGVLIQILCSYVTLPLYALVTQMGSNMKPTIFNERVATALRNWHHTAKKHVKHNKGSVHTPISSRPTTPTHHSMTMSPLHLLKHYKSGVDSFQNSPRVSNFDMDHSENESPSPSHHHSTGDASTSYHHQVEMGQLERNSRDVIIDSTHSSVGRIGTAPQQDESQHEINIGPKDFSFDKRPATYT